MDQKTLNELKALYHSRSVLRAAYKEVIDSVDAQIDVIEKACDHKNPEGEVVIDKIDFLHHCAICAQSVL